MRGQCGNWGPVPCQVLESEPAGAPEGRDPALYTRVSVCYSVGLPGCRHQGLLRKSFFPLCCFPTEFGVKSWFVSFPPVFPLILMELGFTLNLSSYFRRHIPHPGRAPCSSCLPKQRTRGRICVCSGSARRSTGKSRACRWHLLYAFAVAAPARAETRLLDTAWT